MISNFGRKLFTKPLAILIPWLARLGLTPNGATFLGFILAVCAAYLLARGALFSGGLLLLSGAFFDMVDGHLARATKQTSTFGAFWDSTLDRYSESITFIALIVYYAGLATGRSEIVLLAITLVGSLMVSYTRARAEALQIECKVGLLQRPERIILLIAGLLTGWMLTVLWLLAILSNLTALQRIYQVYTETQAHPSPVQQEAVINDENHPVRG